MSQDYQVRQSPDEHQQVAHLRHPMPHPELPRQDRAFLGGRCGGIPLPVQLHQFGLQPKPARTHQRQDSNQTPTRTPSQGRASSARSQMQNERHHCADHLQHKVLSQHRLSDEPRILSPDEIRHRRREEVGAHHDCQEQPRPKPHRRIHHRQHMPDNPHARSSSDFTPKTNRQETDLKILGATLQTSRRWVLRFIGRDTNACYLPRQRKSPG